MAAASVVAVGRVGRMTAPLRRTGDGMRHPTEEPDRGFVPRPVRCVAISVPADLCTLNDRRVSAELMNRTARHVEAAGGVAP